MNILIAINTFIFLILSIIHIYWACGGKWAYYSVLPIKTDGQFLFKPSKLSTLMVACGFMIFALITAGNCGFMHKLLDRKYIHYGTWGIAIIFIVRAIGDFKFVGFAKTIKSTPFAINDNKIFSPLSLIIGMMSLLIAELAPVSAGA
ncbi:MAG TPA: DUF3995 domain-containing protein [Chitinophagaceae bacterium]|nr:DUF3995 domain-containing protein [Chitinophagaceae bacterium]